MTRRFGILVFGLWLGLGSVGSIPAFAGKGAAAKPGLLAPLCEEPGVTNCECLDIPMEEPAVPGGYQYWVYPHEDDCPNPVWRVVRCHRSVGIYMRSWLTGKVEYYGQREEVFMSSMPALTCY